MLMLMLVRVGCLCWQAHAALVAAVTDRGLWDRTYWVLTSDHGYNLGHHRIPSNKFLLYDHSLRIPMVVRGPGIAPGTSSIVSCRPTTKFGSVSCGTTD